MIWLTAPITSAGLSSSLCHLCRALQGWASWSLTPSATLPSQPLLSITKPNPHLIPTAQGDPQRQPLVKTLKQKRTVHLPGPAGACPMSKISAGKEQTMQALAGSHAPKRARGLRGTRRCWPYTSTQCRSSISRPECPLDSKAILPERPNEPALPSQRRARTFDSHICPVVFGGP